MRHASAAAMAVDGPLVLFYLIDDKLALSKWFDVW
jgi:hypothetical protein